MGAAAAPAYPELLAAIRNLQAVDAGENVVPALAVVLRATPAAVEQLRASLVNDRYRVRSRAERAIELAQGQRGR